MVNAKADGYLMEVVLNRQSRHKPTRQNQESHNSETIQMMSYDKNKGEGLDEMWSTVILVLPFHSVRQRTN